MRILVAAVALWGLCVNIPALHAEGYPPLPPGGHYIPCPYSLAPYFPSGYGGVYNQGYRFDTEWRSVRSDMQLPSLNWYVPIGKRDVMSVDGRAIWKDAQVRVSCWIYESFYVLQRHFDDRLFGESGSVR